MIKKIPWKLLLTTLCVLLLCLMARCNSRITYIPDDHSDRATSASDLLENETADTTAPADQALTDLLDTLLVMSEEQFIAKLHLDELLDEESGRNEEFILALSRKAMDLFGYEITSVDADDPSAEQPTAAIAIIVNCLDYEQLNLDLEAATAALAENPDLHTMTEPEVLEMISDTYMDTLELQTRSTEKTVVVLMTCVDTAWVLDDETVLEECLFGSRL